MPTDDRRASSCARAARAIDRSRVPLEVSLSVVVVFVFVVVMFVVVFVVVFVVFVVVFVVFVDDEERERRDATRRDATRRPTRAFVDGGGSLSSRLSRRVSLVATRASVHASSSSSSSSVPRLRRRRGWISRDARRETTSCDVSRDARERRERDERCRSPNRAIEDGRRRTTTTDDVDSIRDLI